MKKILLTLILAGFVGFAFAQNENGPSQIEISATGITEVYKKELKLNKEQYAKVKSYYITFLTHQAMNPGRPEVGREKLEKNMKKTLTEEQFTNWRKQDPNKPFTDEQLAKMNAERRQKSIGR